MPERDFPRPNTPESGLELEWNLPASLATKSALVAAADHLTPGEDDIDDRLYQTRSGIILHVLRNYHGGRNVWSVGVSHEPHFDPNADGGRGNYAYDAFMVDSNRTTERTHVVEAPMYFIFPDVGGEEVSLTKTGKSDRSSPDEKTYPEASEGEAKWLLTEMSEPQELSLEAEDDSYRSGGEIPDYYKDR
jgi:hypothetical protein